MKTWILGGGSVGRVAALYHPTATVLDWRKAPTAPGGNDPARFGAMYLHTPLEGLTTRPIAVMTTVDGHPATEDTVRAYKQKIGKPEDMRGDWEMQFPLYAQGHVVTAWPEAEVLWGQVIQRIWMQERTVELKGGHTLRWDRIISTIPLFSLMEMLNIQPESPLRYQPVAVRQAPVPLDQPIQEQDLRVNYISTPTIPVYRTTDTRATGLRDYEWLYRKNPVDAVALRVLKPGKIYAAPWVPMLIKQLNMMDIYPVGRAGRWAPDELLHDSAKSLQEIA